MNSETVFSVVACALSFSSNQTRVAAQVEQFAQATGGSHKAGALIQFSSDLSKLLPPLSRTGIQWNRLHQGAVNKKILTHNFT